MDSREREIHIEEFNDIYEGWYDARFSSDKMRNLRPEQLKAAMILLDELSVCEENVRSNPDVSDDVIKFRDFLKNKLINLINNKQ